MTPWRRTLHASGLAGALTLGTLATAPVPAGAHAAGPGTLTAAVEGTAGAENQAFHDRGCAGCVDRHGFAGPEPEVNT